MTSENTYSFSFKADSNDEFLELLKPDSHKQKAIDKAQNMLKEIQEVMDGFYKTNPPINRKECRERAKSMARRLQSFNSYCKKNGIKIKVNE